MKIYEIISESPTNEGFFSMLGRIAQGGEELVKPLWNLGRKELVKNAGAEASALAKSQGMSIEKAAEELFKSKKDQIARELKRTEQVKQGKRYVTQPVHPPGTTEQEIAKQLNISPLYLEKGAAREIVGAAHKARGLEIVGKIGIKSYGDLATVVVKRSMDVWGLVELYGPWQDYKEQIDAYKEQYPNATDEQMQAWINRQTVNFVAKEAALLTGAMLGKIVSGLAGKAIGKAFPRVGQVISKMGPVAALTYLGTEENRKAIAAGLFSIMGPEVTDYIGGALSPFTETLRSLDPTASSKVPAAQDTAAAGTTSGAGTGASGAGNAKQDIGSTSGGSDAATGGKATAQGIDPKTGKTPMGRKMWSVDPTEVNNYDITGWIQKPGDPRSIVDPKNPANFLPKPDTYVWSPN